MIKLEDVDISGWKAAVRGMRNPMNSWAKSDSLFDFYNCYKTDVDRDNGFDTLIAFNVLNEDIEDPDMATVISHTNFKMLDEVALGKKDHELMMRLAKAGSVDAKYRRMLVVTVDITAPLYWWKEFDTYKVGTVANSCSTMHKIQAKKFTLDDFSCEHLFDEDEFDLEDAPEFILIYPKDILELTIDALNLCRNRFLETKDKKYWWQMIQLLPSSYNQRRTVMLNYEVLAGIYQHRKDHKLDEWRTFCEWIKELPYSEIITLEEN